LCLVTNNYLFRFGLSICSRVLASLGKFMLRIGVGRRTQVVKGEVCKTSMQRFESARRLHFLPDFIRQPGAHLLERVLRLSTVLDCFAPFQVSDRRLKP